jgi:hypothetical protein
MDPIKVFFYILSIILFMIVIFFAAQLFLEIRIVVENRYIDRFSTELAENIFSSPLTVDRAVFSSDELDKFNGDSHKLFREGSDKNELNRLGGEEPYTRHCSYAYQIFVEDKENGRSWQFGYKGAARAEIDSEHKEEIERSILVAYPKPDKGGYDFHAGRMVLTVTDDLFTEATCMIEDAWRYKEIQKNSIKCTDLLLGLCALPIKRSETNSDYICLFSSPGTGSEEYLTCRYLPGIPFQRFDSGFTGSQKMLIVIPVKESLKDDANALSCSESNMKFEDRVPLAGEKVGIVIMCFDRGGIKSEEMKIKMDVCYSYEKISSTEIIALRCTTVGCRSGETVKKTVNSLGECRDYMTARKNELIASGYTVTGETISDMQNKAPSMRLTREPKVLP